MIDDVVVLSGGYGSETWVNLTRGFHKFRGEYIEYSGRKSPLVVLESVVSDSR